MALASSGTTATSSPLPGGQHTTPRHKLAVPGLLQCLVVSWSQLRAQLLQAAAENEDWQPVVCQDVTEFMRQLFQLNAPLTIVDLPSREAAGYPELCQAAQRVGEVNEALLVVCGTEGNTAEEVWARQLGVWTYLPAASDLTGLEFVFGEARKALARQSSAYVECEGYR